MAISPVFGDMLLSSRQAILSVSMLLTEHMFRITLYLLGTHLVFSCIFVSLNGALVIMFAQLVSFRCVCAICQQ